MPSPGIGPLACLFLFLLMLGTCSAAASLEKIAAKCEVSHAR